MPLHFFMPFDPVGHIVSMPTVHCCEHTGWPAMSIVLVQTPLVHSVDVLLTVTHAAPNAPGAGPVASGGGDGELPEQAQRQTTNAQPRSSRCMTCDVTMISLASPADDVIGVLHCLTSRSPDLSARNCSDLFGHPRLGSTEFVALADGSDRRRPSRHGVASYEDLRASLASSVRVVTDRCANTPYFMNSVASPRGLLPGPQRIPEHVPRS